MTIWTLAQTRITDERTNGLKEGRRGFRIDYHALSLKGGNDNI